MSLIHSNGITKRWAATTLAVIYLVLTSVAIISSVVLRNYYYRVVEDTIDSKIQIQSVESFFANYNSADSSSFESAARDFAENFAANNIMEIWIIDRQGRVSVSSQGFSVDSTIPIPEFEQTMLNDDGVSAWVGRNPYGERIYAKTFVVRGQNNVVLGAIRAMVSLQEIDKQFVKYVILFFAATAIVMCFVTVSGMFFIKSIVRPVKEINVTAKRIAKGDLDARVENESKYKDEISELSETINDMASELKRTEGVKSDFISTVSHELRTPLTAIKGWAETLRDTPADDAELMRMGIDVIINESNRLDNLVEDLLDFSRIRSGRTVAHKKQDDLFEILEFTVDLFRARAVKDEIKFEYFPSDEKAPVMVDRELMKQVFVNIIDNAFKYTEKDGSVSVVATRDEDLATVTVVDTGCGIPKKDLPHIKEKFYKANTFVHGSGIGLAVVDELVALHDGTFQIDSIEHKGTVATITIPIITI